LPFHQTNLAVANVAGIVRGIKKSNFGNFRAKIGIIFQQVNKI
jgi:hypothetical protein